MLPSAERAWRVRSGSLKYSKGVAVLNQISPGCALGAGLHVVVEDVQVAQQHAAHGALVRQPLGAVAGGEAQAFGGAVVLVDDRAPPVDHLFLHRHRAGCGGMHGDLQRRQVVAARTSAGSFSMRLNIVGTSCVWVTRCFSTSAR
jgi:hypothetical protein